MLSIKTSSDTHADSNTNTHGNTHTYTNTYTNTTMLRSGIRYRWTVGSCVSGTEAKEEITKAKIVKRK